jgi:hypothetical protein
MTNDDAVTLVVSGDMANQERPRQRSFYATCYQKRWENVQQQQPLSYIGESESPTSFLAVFDLTWSARQSVTIHYDHTRVHQDT